jgi:arylsulfatase A-like enzyme
LISRRLVERGVRFVHISTQAQFWDHHAAMATRLPAAVAHVDRPTAALIRDLKQRGLLDSTLVAWGGEHGRLPIIEKGAGLSIGRDHNTEGFTMLFAGGGFKGGFTYGNTDEFGYRAVENVVHHYDYLATVLHLFGLDHKKLVYQRNNRELTLTDGQDARVVHDLLC